MLFPGPAPQPTNPFLPAAQQSGNFGFSEAEEYNGISMNPTQGGGGVNYSSGGGSSGYGHYNSQY